MENKITADKVLVAPIKRIISRQQIRAIRGMRDKGFLPESIARAQGLSVGEIRLILANTDGKRGSEISQIEYYLENEEVV